ncbi:hypothetical protein J6590_007969 [Homalodisca vitripennis]|nr:hypothetical protein J6590_007969 [Homalodisca vitripennis]
MDNFLSINEELLKSTHVLSPAWSFCGVRIQCCPAVLGLTDPATPAIASQNDRY